MTATMIASKDASKLSEENRVPLLGTSSDEPSTSCSSEDSTDEELGVHRHQKRWKWNDFFRFCGSGLLMSVAYLDPGNLEADIQVGVQAGYSLLWWYAICSILFGLAFQCLAGRLGLVTGGDLAHHCGQRYPKGARWAMWVLLELAIVGADIQETIGSALAITILSGGRLPLWLGCIFISVSAFGMLLLDRTGFRQLEAVFGIFIAIEAVAMGVNFFQAEIPAKDLATGMFVPRLTRATLPVAVGALGSLVMPYNVFFQSSVVNARPRDRDTDDKKRVLINYMRVENLVMLILAFIINVFVVCVFAKGFYNPPVTQHAPSLLGLLGAGLGDDTQGLGLETAGDHLAERYGTAFKYIWAVGLLASGQVATIGLTYAGQLVMTGLLNLKVEAGVRMVATRTVALLPTVILAVAFEASNTFDVVAQALNIVQSVVLPFALIPAVHMTALTSVMGPRFVNAPWITWVTGAITGGVLLVNGYLLYDFFCTLVPLASTKAMACFGLVLAAYYMAAAYFAVGPENAPGLVARGWARLCKLVRWARSCGSLRSAESIMEVHW